MAFNQPVDAAVGAGEPHGNTNTCQAVAVLPSAFKGCVHPNNAVDWVMEVAVSVLGLAQVGAGAQVIFEVQPVEFVVAFDVKTNVKHPVGPDAVIGAGSVVPEKVPIKFAGETKPSYMVKKSVFNCVENEVKVTFT